MITQQHAEMVEALTKPGRTILEEMTPLRAELVHMAIAIPSEAGELADAIKKHTMYNKVLDLENVIEELGDLEFYLERLRYLVGVTRDQTLEANIKKLARRYTNFKYSDQQAHDRADKQ